MTEQTWKRIYEELRIELDSQCWYIRRAETLPQLALAAKAARQAAIELDRHIEKAA